MDDKTYVENFVKECSETQLETTGEKFVSWETLFTILVYEGLRLLLPELKEWVRLGAAAVAMKRQELKKQLVAYAKEKELDFPAAEKAAAAIADKINEKTLGRIVKGLQAEESSE
jgi:hypothetical protein